MNFIKFNCQLLSISYECIECIENMLAKKIPIINKNPWQIINRKKNKRDENILIYIMNTKN